MDAADASPLVVFDDGCVLCNGAIRFLLAHERAPELRFADRGSPIAAAVIGDVPPRSVVLAVDGRVFTRSTASLELARYLRRPWPILAVLLVIPRPVRDLVYGVVARNRERWFGRGDCLVPPAGARHRFLHDV